MNKTTILVLVILAGFFLWYKFIRKPAAVTKGNSTVSNQDPIAALLEAEGF